MTAAVDQLVEEGTDGYKDDYTFTVAKSKVEQAGVYTSFKQLVTAMQNNSVWSLYIGFRYDRR